MIEFDCFEDAGEFLADCDILWKQEQESHPERFVVVHHACGCAREVYLPLTSPTEADREKTRQAASQEKCWNCAPCGSCHRKGSECECFDDPFEGE